MADSAEKKSNSAFWAAVVVFIFVLVSGFWPGVGLPANMLAGAGIAWFVHTFWNA